MKRNDSCNATFTSIHASSKEGWYFDSGWSCHMTGNSTFFSNLKKCSSGYVTFGGRAKGKVFGEGDIIKLNLPDFKMLDSSIVFQQT